MPAAFSQEELASAPGRRRAWRALMLGDHGALRLLYDNSHEISTGKMWRTYQPAPHDLARWRDRGVKTVVNLRGEMPSGFFILEQEACARLGLALRSFRVFSREAPSKEILHSARRLFAEIDYPALMHCKSGADRVGLMSTLFLFLHEGRPLDQAMKQLSLRYGHVRQGKTGVMDYALNAYIAHARRENIELNSAQAFFNWVDEVYDPGAMKAAFRGSWWANTLTDKILRRE